MAALLAVGCNKETTSEVEQGPGQVAFECSIAPSVDVQAVSKAAGQRELPANCIPGTEDLTLEIQNGTGSPVATYDPMSEYDQPYLDAGTYKALFSYGNPEAEGADAACFAGETNFTIVARKTITQQVSLGLSNSLYTVEFTEWFRKYYSTYNMTLTTESGHQAAYSNQSVSTVPIFVKPETKLFISGTATKTNGVEVEFPKTEIGTTKARTWHTVSIDAGQASQVNIVVSLDDTPTSIQEVSVELNPDA